MDITIAPATGRVPCLVLSDSSALTSRGISWLKPRPLCADARSGSNSDNEPAWSSCCISIHSSRIPRRRSACNCIPTPSVSGGNAGPKATSLWRMDRDGAASPIFPPRDEAIVKAIACETVAETKLPLSRQSLDDLTTRADYALEKPISPSTVWRILDTDAIKPWRYEYWIFPRDPRFAEKAERVLDLYARLLARHTTWSPRITSLARTRRRASRLASVVTETLPRLRAARVEWNTSTDEEARCSILPLGTSAGSSPGSMRGKDGNRLVRSIGRSSDAEREPYRSAESRLLDRGQRLLASRGGQQRKRLRKAYGKADLGSYAGACQLAQPGRDLFLADSKEGPDAKRLRQLG